MSTKKVFYINKCRSDIYQSMGITYLLTYLLTHLLTSWLCNYKGLLTITPPYPQFLIDNMKMDIIPTKIKWKICALFTVHFKFWKVLLIKIFWSPDHLFLVVFISFYISRYHFHRFLKLYSTLSDKKSFSSPISLF